MAKKKTIESISARIHECSNCRRRGVWTEDWAWYGSYQDEDDEKPLIKACSEACRMALFKAGKVHCHSGGEIGKREAKRLGLR